MEHSGNIQRELSGRPWASIPTARSTLKKKSTKVGAEYNLQTWVPKTRVNKTKRRIPGVELRVQSHSASIIIINWRCAKNWQIREDSGKIQWTVREQSVNSQGTFRERLPPRVLQVPTSNKTCDNNHGSMLSRFILKLLLSTWRSTISLLQCFKCRLCTVH